MARLDIQYPSGQVDIDPGAFTGDALYKALHGGAESPIVQQGLPVTGESLAQAIKNVPKEDEMSWLDVPIKAYANIVPSGLRMAKGIGEAVTHPVESVKGIWDLAAGTLRNVTPKHVAEWIDKADKNPEAATHASSVADLVGQSLKERYGSSSGFKKALAYDPVGVMSDLSAVASGGAGLIGAGRDVLGTAAQLSRGGRLTSADVAAYDAATKAKNALESAATYTNPVLAPVVAGAKVAQGALGGATGVGSNAVKGAFEAGMSGDKTFMPNLLGEADMTKALDDAKYNLNLMKQAKNEHYRSGMVDIKSDKNVLSFDDIDKVLNKSNKENTLGVKKIDDEATKVIKQFSDEINAWKNPVDELGNPVANPEMYHTPEGLDALKQRLGALKDKIDPVKDKNAARIANNIYNSVKETISTQAPAYSDVMKDYASASDEISQIEKALSLGNKASVDTAMRKLQSLTRNNVNTNYGHRLSLAQQLENQPGAKPFLNALYGQAFSSPTARGGAGLVEGGAGLMGTVGGNPMYLAAIPFQTPSLVGKGLYYSGRAAQGLKQAANATGMTPAKANALADLLYLQNKAQEK